MIDVIFVVIVPFFSHLRDMHSVLVLAADCSM